MLNGSVVVCLDKFRGSLTAVEATAALARGIEQARPGLEVVQMPVADGGEGTVAAVVGAGATRVVRRVSGPTGQPVDASLAVSHGRAVVELAEASGLARCVGAPQPLVASTFGTGELMRAALDLGCRSVVLAVGGSASTDGGAGLLQALGARLLDADGCDLPRGGGALHRLTFVDLSGLDPRVRECRITLAADVDNPLLGPSGAAAVFAPQKGAGPADVAVLETGLMRWADCVAAAVGADRSGEPGAGAAGGTGFAALAVLGADLRPGIDVILDEMGADRQLAGARMVVVGEGRLDEQSLRGKAPVGVARRSPPGVPVVAVSGDCTVGAELLRRSGIAGSESLLAAAGGDLRRAMVEAPRLLEAVGRCLPDRYLPADVAGRGFGG
jgi:glycerate kinase